MFGLAHFTTEEGAEGPPKGPGSPKGPQLSAVARRRGTEHHLSQITQFSIEEGTDLSIVSQFASDYIMKDIKKNQG